MDVFEPFEFVGGGIESGGDVRQGDRPSGPRPVSSGLHRPGFTMPEFLVAVAIVLTLFSMSAGGIAAARGSHKRLKTRDVIAKLNAIVASHYSSYRWLNVHQIEGTVEQWSTPVDGIVTRGAVTLKCTGGDLEAIKSGFYRIRFETRDTHGTLKSVSAWLGFSATDPTTGEGKVERDGQTSDWPKELQRGSHFRIETDRLKTMHGDLPDSWTDVDVLAKLADEEAAVAAKANTSFAESQLTGRQQVYAALWRAMSASEKTAVAATNGSAECLFMIVMQGGIADCLDCRSMLIDIGDQDGDGMPEFLDGWERPIGFVFQPSALRLPASSPQNFFSTRIPFDGSAATAAEARARVVRPLIVSAGPDGIPGLSADASPLIGVDGVLLGAADNITNFDEEAKR